MLFLPQAINFCCWEVSSILLILSFFLVVFCFIYRDLQLFISIPYTNLVKLAIFEKGVRFTFLNSSTPTLIFLLLKLFLSSSEEVESIADFYWLTLFFNLLDHFDSMLILDFSLRWKSTNYRWLRIDRYLFVIFWYAEVELPSSIIFIQVKLAC